jgi:acyl-coenzyme A thioesterase PaaI-like protein
MTPGERLRTTWERLSPLPFGRRLFALAFGFMVPYTGSMGATVEELRPGYARMVLRDRRAVRNHLNSVHAIALANLGEATSGLAMNVGLPPGVRAIVTSLNVEYLKKARGTLTAECHAQVPEDLVPGQDRDQDVVAEIKNQAGDVVARFTARWRVGLVQSSQ